MALRQTSHELTQRAILKTYRQAADAHTVEDAIVFHNELIDLFAIEAMIMRMSSCHGDKKAETIREITARAEYHRDVVDRLTDILETNQQLIWRP